uniref:Uncharacterized protein n=1 Tax=Rhizophora mucronata TaxID=61149 RepID=A0A2P2P7T1_RHIMU
MLWVLCSGSLSTILVSRPIAWYKIRGNLDRLRMDGN